MFKFLFLGRGESRCFSLIASDVAVHYLSCSTGFLITRHAIVAPKLIFLSERFSIFLNIPEAIGLIQLELFSNYYVK